MATVEVKNLDGQKVKELELADELFAAKPNQSLLWEAVKAHLASERRGTHSTKSRGEVSGGGKKPWRQKGTGRARAGSTRSSLWRHGSIAHGPKPRDYAYEIPRKMQIGALRSALAAKYLERKLTVVEGFKLPEPKTKAFAEALRKLGVSSKALVVSDAANRNLELSARNLGGVAVVRHHKVGAYDVLSHDHLLASEAAIVRIQEALRK